MDGINVNYIETDEVLWVHEWATKMERIPLLEAVMCVERMKTSRYVVLTSEQSEGRCRMLWTNMDINSPLFERDEPGWYIYGIKPGVRPMAGEQ